MIDFRYTYLAGCVVGSLLVMLLFGADASASSTSNQKLDFRVYLEDREIGYHRVELNHSPQATDVRVETAFDVKILFVNAFRYRHQARERWNGTCLENVETQTDYGGKPLFVRSETTENGLKVVSKERQVTLSGCVRSYAYWDLERLRSSSLLNTQSGEYQPVSLKEQGIKPLRVGEFEITARSYQLETEEGTISLWYGDDLQWIGLQTRIRGNRVLSYINEAINVDAQS